MTNEYALHLLYQLQIGASVDAKPIIPQYEFAQALGVAIKALEQQPCEDYISREAVEEITFQEPSYTDTYNILTEVREKVRALPPVTPQRPKGKWITWKEAGNYIPSETRFECSVCHDAAQTLCNGLDLLSPYCPNCGAEMNGGEDEVSD